MVYMEGSIRTGSYDKDGQKVYTTEYISYNVKMLNKKQGVSNEIH